MTWLREDVLKAQGNKEYVPFTVQIDPLEGQRRNRRVLLARRVEDRGRAAAGSRRRQEGRQEGQGQGQGQKSDYAYEDISFVPVTAGQTSMKISRSFTVAAGNYDVFLVAKEPTPEKAPKNAPPPKISAIKQTVNVPDFWNDELNTAR